MKDLIADKNVLLAFSDAAGAKAVLAFADTHRRVLKAVVAVSNRTYDFYPLFGLEVHPYSERDPTGWIDSTGADVLITGTSFPVGLEVELIKAAHRSAVTSISLIDHWVNMAERFRQADALILPDWVGVIDERARANAMSAGLPAARVVITGNPYHEYLRKWRPTRSRSCFLNDVGLGANCRYLLYAPEPLSRYGLAEKCGFDELDGLQMILEAMGSEADTDTHVIVKAHPNQDHAVFEEFLGKSSDARAQNPRVHYLRQGDLLTLIDNAECVLGFFSNSLVEASILGKPVIRPLMRLRSTYRDALSELEGPRFMSVRDAGLFAQLVRSI